MNCPRCPNVVLVMSERQGVEIDYCPTCRGVWLDRGELDKILERSAQPAASQAPQGQGFPPGSVQGRDGRPYDDHGRHDHDHGHHHDKHHRRKSWLMEILD